MRNYLALRYFMEIASCLNFSDAAKNLHISQPGLSQQIARLEREIGHQLLHRTTRTVMLTEIGEYLYENLSHSFKNIDQVVAKLRENGSGPRSTLRIAAVMSAASTIVPNLIKELKSRYPDMQFFIHETTSVRASELTLSGEYHLGFIRTPADSKKLLPPGLEWFEFEKQPLQLAVPEGHWAAKEKEIALYELRNETFLHYDPQDSPSLYYLLEYACLAAGFIPKSIGAGPEVLTRANLIKSGVGITLLPRDMIRLLEPYSIIGVPLKGINLYSFISVVWNRANIPGIARDALEILHELKKTS